MSRLAQYVEEQTEALCTAVKRILMYIAGSKSVGISYCASDDLTPIGYSNSDWGGCKINRKSTTGYSFIMDGGTVSWKSQKQGCVAKSFTEAKYMAFAATVKEAIWISYIAQFAKTRLILFLSISLQIIKEPLKCLEMTLQVPGLSI